MREQKRTGVRALAFALFLCPLWSHPASGAANGFRRIPDVHGADPASLTVTRTQVLAATKTGIYSRPLGGAAWTTSLDTGAWKDVLPLLPNGDTLLAIKDQAEGQFALSTDGGKGWTPVSCPGGPLLFCRSGLFCRVRANFQDSGLYVSRDLGKTWAKLSGDAVVSLALWKNGLVGLSTAFEVFTMDPATGARAPMIPDPRATVDIYGLFNVGDSLFAWDEFGTHLFRCQSGGDRWVQVLERDEDPPLSVRSSPFGIALRQGDSVTWSRDYGKSWRRYPQPPDAGFISFAPEPNRLWAVSGPLWRMDSARTAWVSDLAGMPGVLPGNLESSPDRLFAGVGNAVYQTDSPESAWTPEDSGATILRLLPSRQSAFLLNIGANAGNPFRIDRDGSRTVYPLIAITNRDNHFLWAYAGSRGRVYLYGQSTWPPSAGFVAAAPNDQHWSWLSLPGEVRTIDWFAGDGDTIVTGHDSIVFHSKDGGNSWDTCPIPGNPRVNGMAFTGGAFLGFTSDGLYRSFDPTAGWKGAGFQGWLLELLAANGDTLLARDPGRLLLRVDGGRTWGNVETPYAPQAIGRAALVWSSICLIGRGAPDSLGIQCGSLSGLTLKEVDGLHPVLGREASFPKLRLNWGRFEGPLPGRHGPEVSAGVDGRIRPALRARHP